MMVIAHLMGYFTHPLGARTWTVCPSARMHGRTEGFATIDVLRAFPGPADVSIGQGGLKAFADRIDGTALFHRSVHGVK
jgi:hypothetical protein